MTSVPRGVPIQGLPPGMHDPAGSRRIAVLSRDWGRSGSEAGFVARNVAGALSRHAPVDVLVPGAPGPAFPDGAFDPYPVGSGPGAGTWPAEREVVRPDILAPHLVVTDALDDRAGALSRRLAPEAPTVFLAPGRPSPPPRDGIGVHRLTVSVNPRSGIATDHHVGLHVPVNPMAAERRHNALGETGYVLVLTDRGPASEAVGGHRGGPPFVAATTRSETPTPLASWLASRFPSRLLVVVEDAVAWVWRLRSLRGHLAVDTRTDLQRFMAHARVVVDLRPGSYVARECVEALRFGVPVVVPDGTVAADLAAAGGGLWFRDVAELLGAVAALEDPACRTALGEQGRAVANDHYGDPDRFVSRVGDALVQIYATAAGRP
ncbi:MAG: glycosyltransferase [Acidimicrobiales bacterium]